MAIASSITCKLLTVNDTNTIYEQFKEKDRINIKN